MGRGRALWLTAVSIILRDTPPLSETTETEWKDPSLEQVLQKQSFQSCPRQVHSPTHSSQLLAFVWYLLNIFFCFFFALKELEPGVSACPVKLNAEAPAGAECQPSPGDGHGTAALKVRRCSAPFTMPLLLVLPSCQIAFLPKLSSLQQ